jgi:[ribosomal protein S5]-alanine N-acetyltransferase
VTPVLTPARSPRRRREDALSIHGGGLQLRYPRSSDAAALYRLASDPAVTRFFSWGPYRRQEEAGDWLRTLPERRQAGTALELAVANEQDELIGITLLSECSQRDRRCVVGSWLGHEHWGTGVNRKAKALVAALAFGPLQMRRIGAYADVENARSQVALERVGFVREGVLRAFHRHCGEPRDVVVYALLYDRWQASPLASLDARFEGDPPASFLAASDETATARDR